MSEVVLYCDNFHYALLKPIHPEQPLQPPPNPPPSPPRERRGRFGFSQSSSEDDSSPDVDMFFPMRPFFPRRNAIRRSFHYGFCSFNFFFPLTRAEIRAGRLEQSPVSTFPNHPPQPPFFSSLFHKTKFSSPPQPHFATFTPPIVLRQSGAFCPSKPKLRNGQRTLRLDGRRPGLLRHARFGLPMLLHRLCRRRVAPEFMSLISS